MTLKNTIIKRLEIEKKDYNQMSSLEKDQALSYIYSKKAKGIELALNIIKETSNIDSGLKKINDLILKEKNDSNINKGLNIPVKIGKKYLETPEYY